MKTVKLSAFLIGTFLLFSQVSLAEMMLFVGDGCPHCENVEHYLEQNNVTDKVDIGIYEVYYNQENQNLYREKAEEAGYEGGGVPFLFDNGDYVVGDSSITTYIEGVISQGGNEAEVAQSDPVEMQETTISDEDSDELNEIIEEEVENGEENKEMEDNSNKENSNTEGIINTTSLAISGGILLIVVILIFVFRKK